MLDGEKWYDKGLVSDITHGTKNWKLEVLEAMENSNRIDFIIDGMGTDLLNYPEAEIKQGFGKNMPVDTHWEMDQVIKLGYSGKLHLWENGAEVVGIKYEQWINMWKEIRDLP